MRKTVKRAGIATAYTGLNFRYASLILPVGVVAYLMGVPTALVVTAAVLLSLATVAELITSIVNGISTAQALTYQEEYANGGLDELAKYANGGWVGLDGSEQGEAGDEGEDPPEEGQPAK